MQPPSDRCWSCRLCVKGLYACTARIDQQKCADFFSNWGSYLNIKWRTKTISAKEKFLQGFTELSLQDECRWNGWFINCFLLKPGQCLTNFDKLINYFRKNTCTAVLKHNDEVLLMSDCQQVVQHYDCKEFNNAGDRTLVCLLLSKTSKRTKHGSVPGKPYQWVHTDVLDDHFQQEVPERSRLQLIDVHRAIPSATAPQTKMDTSKTKSESTEKTINHPVCISSPVTSTYGTLQAYSDRTRHKTPRKRLLSSSSSDAEGRSYAERLKGLLYPLSGIEESSSENNERDQSKRALCQNNSQTDPANTVKTYDSYCQKLYDTFSPRQHDHSLPKKFKSDYYKEEYEIKREEQCHSVRDKVKENQSHTVKENVKENQSQNVKEKVKENQNSKVKESHNHSVKENNTHSVKEEVKESQSHDVREKKKHAVKENQSQNEKEKVKEKVKESHSHSVKEKVKESQSHVKEKQKHTVKENNTHSVKEKVKESHSHSVKENNTHSMKEKVKESQSHVKEKQKHTVKEKVKENQSQNVKEKMKEKHSHTVKESNTHSVKESQSHAVKENQSHTVKEKVKEKRKHTVEEKMKENQSHAVKEKVNENQKHIVKVKEKHSHNVKENQCNAVKEKVNENQVHTPNENVTEKQNHTVEENVKENQSNTVKDKEKHVILNEKKNISSYNQKLSEENLNSSFCQGKQHNTVSENIFDKFGQEMSITQKQESKSLKTHLLEKVKSHHRSHHKKKKKVSSRDTEADQLSSSSERTVPVSTMSPASRKQTSTSKEPKISKPKTEAEKVLSSMIIGYNRKEVSMMGRIPKKPKVSAPAPADQLTASASSIDSPVSSNLATSDVQKLSKTSSNTMSDSDNFLTSSFKQSIYKSPSVRDISSHESNSLKTILKPSSDMYTYRQSPSNQDSDSNISETSSLKVEVSQSMSHEDFLKPNSSTILSVSSLPKPSSSVSGDSHLRRTPPMSPDLVSLVRKMCSPVSVSLVKVDNSLSPSLKKQLISSNRTNESLYVGRIDWSDDEDPRYLPHMDTGEDNDYRGAHDFPLLSERGDGSDLLSTLSDSRSMQRLIMQTVSLDRTVGKKDSKTETQPSCDGLQTIPWMKSVLNREYKGDVIPGLGDLDEIGRTDPLSVVARNKYKRTVIKTSTNIQVAVSGIEICTPLGKQKHELQIEDIVKMSLHRTALFGDLMSEKALLLYRSVCHVLHQPRQPSSAKTGRQVSKEWDVAKNYSYTIKMQPTETSEQDLEHFQDKSLPDIVSEKENRINTKCIKAGDGDFSSFETNKSKPTQVLKNTCTSNLMNVDSSKGHETERDSEISKTAIDQVITRDGQNVAEVEDQVGKDHQNMIDAMLRKKARKKSRWDSNGESKPEIDTSTSRETTLSRVNEAERKEDGSNDIRRVVSEDRGRHQSSSKDSKVNKSKETSGIKEQSPGPSKRSDSKETTLEHIRSEPSSRQPSVERKEKSGRKETTTERLRNESGSRESSVEREKRSRSRDISIERIQPISNNKESSAEHTKLHSGSKESSVERIRSGSSTRESSVDRLSKKSSSREKSVECTKKLDNKASLIETKGDQSSKCLEERLRNLSDTKVPAEFLSKQKSGKTEAASDKSSNKASSTDKAKNSPVASSSSKSTAAKVDAKPEAIGKRLENLSTSEKTRAEKRQKRQFHPYRKEESRPAPTRNTPSWSFDVAYLDMHELLQNMTDNQFVVQGKQPANVSQWGKPLGTRRRNRSRSGSPKVNRGRFSNFKFNRAPVLRSPVYDDRNSDDENESIRPDMIPDLEDRARRADIVEELFMGRAEEEDEEFNKEKTIYEPELPCSTDERRKVVCSTLVEKGPTQITISVNTRDNNKTTSQPNTDNSPTLMKTETVLTKKVAVPAKDKILTTDKSSLHVSNKLRANSESQQNKDKPQVKTNLCKMQPFESQGKGAKTCEDSVKTSAKTDNLVTKGPSEQSTTSANKTVTKGPSEQSTTSANKTVTKAPSEQSTISANKTVTKAPSEQSTTSANKTVTKAPSEQSTTSANKTVTKAPSEQSTQSANKTDTKAPSEQSTTSANKTVTKGPSEQSTQSANKTVTKVPSEQSTQSANKTVTKVPSEQSTESANKTVTKGPSEQSTASANKTVTNVPSEQSITSANITVTKAPSEQSTTSANKTVTKAPSEQSTTSANKTVIKAPSEQSTTSANKGPSKQSTTSANKTVTKALSVQSTESAIKTVVNVEVLEKVLEQLYKDDESKVNDRSDSKDKDNRSPTSSDTEDEDDDNEPWYIITDELPDEPELCEIVDDETNVNSVGTMIDIDVQLTDSESDPCFIVTSCLSNEHEMQQSSIATEVSAVSSLKETAETTVAIENNINKKETETTVAKENKNIERDGTHNREDKAENCEVTVETPVVIENKNINKEDAETTEAIENKHIKRVNTPHDIEEITHFSSTAGVSAFSSKVETANAPEAIENRNRKRVDTPHAIGVQLNVNKPTIRQISDCVEYKLDNNQAASSSKASLETRSSHTSSNCLNSTRPIDNKEQRPCTENKYDNTQLSDNDNQRAKTAEYVKSDKMEEVSKSDSKSDNIQNPLGKSDNIQNQLDISDNTQHSHGKGDNGQFSLHIDDDSSQLSNDQAGSAKPFDCEKQNFSEGELSKSDNTQLSHDKSDNTQPSHDKSDNTQPSRDESDNTQLSHDKSDNAQPSHGKSDNTQLSRDNTQPSHGKSDNTQPSHDKSDNTQLSRDNTQPSHSKSDNIQLSCDNTQPSCDNTQLPCGKIGNTQHAYAKNDGTQFLYGNSDNTHLSHVSSDNTSFSPYNNYNTQLSHSKSDNTQLINGKSGNSQHLLDNTSILSKSLTVTNDPPKDKNNVESTPANTIDQRMDKSCTKTSHSVRDRKDLNNIPHEMGGTSTNTPDSTVELCNSANPSSTITPTDNQHRIADYTGLAVYYTHRMTDAVVKTDECRERKQLAETSDDTRCAKAKDSDSRTSPDKSRDGCMNVLSAYEIHRHLEPSCTQPSKSNNTWFNTTGPICVDLSQPTTDYSSTPPSTETVCHHDTPNMTLSETSQYRSEPNNANPAQPTVHKSTLVNVEEVRICEFSDTTQNTSTNTSQNPTETKCSDTIPLTDECKTTNTVLQTSESGDTRYINPTDSSYTELNEYDEHKNSTSKPDAVEIDSGESFISTSTGEKSVYKDQPKIKFNKSSKCKDDPVLIKYNPNKLASIFTAETRDSKYSGNTSQKIALALIESEYSDISHSSGTETENYASEKSSQNKSVYDFLPKAIQLDKGPTLTESSRRSRVRRRSRSRKISCTSSAQSSTSKSSYSTIQFNKGPTLAESRRSRSRKISCTSPAQSSTSKSSYSTIQFNKGPTLKESRRRSRSRKISCTSPTQSSPSKSQYSDTTVRLDSDGSSKHRTLSPCNQPSTPVGTGDTDQTGRSASVYPAVPVCTQVSHTAASSSPVQSIPSLLTVARMSSPHYHQPFVPYNYQCSPQPSLVPYPPLRGSNLSPDLNYPNSTPSTPTYMPWSNMSSPLFNVRSPEFLVGSPQYPPSMWSPRFIPPGFPFPWTQQQNQQLPYHYGYDHTETLPTPSPPPKNPYEFLQYYAQSMRNSTQNKK